ncbi:MoxR-like ATPase [Alicyclobacillus sacchari]|uniref:MoxR-like ATPase n=1 Tax=Alicyclobacillus sacchari TaxID=392010 RepID=A0A4R8LW72_9BACL|nr:MoxR family ATPase [Alicyclobacillus sacchari]TDY51095.1 MoxR-like ATPase [Alicyclobacillus sacchari]GMA56340.1 magnesium chelatase [Alicyclobacillus sacchari]
MAEPMEWRASSEALHKEFKSVVESLSQVVIGQREAIELLLAACLAGGHALLEDVPGTGKTRLASSLAAALGLSFHRVQGTPDLLPADVVGTTIYHPAEEQFRFHPGPIFTNVLLMDEINRATPRTQSALLEAMAEGQVSADGETMPLPQPFFVIATANPVESQGVFPLPEAQLDRFLVQIRLGYLDADLEMAMVKRVAFGHDAPAVEMLTPAKVLAAQDAVRQTYISDDVLRYLIELSRATRNHDQIILGASPRAIVLLTRLTQAIAFLAGRSFVTPDDVRRAFPPVMSHRLQTDIGWMDRNAVDRVLTEIVSSVPVPHEREEG